MVRVLVFKPWQSSFIERDQRIISKHYQARTIEWSSYTHSLFRKGIGALRLMIDMFWADVVFIWFAGSHANLLLKLSKVFRTRVVVVVGGYEVASVPKIQYGAMLNNNESGQVLEALNGADAIIAVSEFSRKDILKLNGDLNPILIYNAIDTWEFAPENQEKENLVITVAVISRESIERKGLRTFVEAASIHPETRFAVIGGCRDGSIEELKSIAPHNVIFTGRVNDDELLKWYQHAKVYCQLSAYESFGVSLAEAMSCCCIPVTTREGALPEVAGDVGYYVPYGDAKATAGAISKALDTNKGGAARERAVALFDVRIREEQIIKVINEVASVLTSS